MYGTELWEDAICGLANWPIAFNNFMYGITDEIRTFDYSCLQVKANDPMAPWIAATAPVSMPLATLGSGEAGLGMVLSRTWMGFQASSIGMKLAQFASRSKGATSQFFSRFASQQAYSTADDLILTGKQTLVPASKFGGTGGLRIKALSGFGNQESAQYLQSLAKSNGDDALIGFIQNGKIILQRSYRGAGRYYGHADFIRSGMIKQTDDLLGFQVIKYNGKISVHGMSELNAAVDSQGKLPATILQQVKNLLGIITGG